MCCAFFANQNIIPDQQQTTETTKQPARTNQNKNEIATMEMVSYRKIVGWND